MKSWLVKIAIVLTVSGLGWSQPDDMSITTPDGKTTVIRWNGPHDQADPVAQLEQILTKFLLGSQDGRLTIRAGRNVTALDKQGNQVSMMTPRGKKTASCEGELKHLMGSIRAARAEGQATACESNLKNLAVGVEMYASDHKNNYPDSLKQLLSGKYLRRIPTCPAAGRDTYSATYRKTGQAYEFHCSGSHAGREAGHPFYNSNDGLTP
jgi:hypothetical protein